MDRPVAERVRHALEFRIAEVVRTQRLTPLMARITFSDPGFSAFPSLAHDDHVKVFFPPRGGEPVVPGIGPHGLEWPADAPRPEGRDYTPRSFNRDRRELVIDFVLHEGGVAADWAANAKRGDRLGIGGPRASFVVRNDLDFYVLIGDETALPAIGRRIEELPRGTEAIAIVEVADAAERQNFVTEANLDLRWVMRSAGESLLAAARTAQLPKGNGYIFIAGEASMASALRDHFVKGGHDEGLIKAAGYWRRGEADFDDGHAH